MATIPRSPPRSRKSPQHTHITATPPRRSRRIAYEKPFRFNDLPPELRNTIYSNLLRRDEGSREIGLVDVLPATAKALSQVSRSVRTESMSVFYSENSFMEMCEYRSTAHETQQEVNNAEGWFAVFGKLAAPHIRSLAIAYVEFYAPKGDPYMFCPAFPDLHGVDNLPHLDRFYEEYRASALARIVRQSNHSHWARDLEDSRLDNFPIGTFRAFGELCLKPEALRTLLTGLPLVVPCATLGDPSLVFAALLKQLE